MISTTSQNLSQKAGLFLQLPDIASLKTQIQPGKICTFEAREKPNDDAWGDANTVHKTTTKNHNFDGLHFEVRVNTNNFVTFGNMQFTKQKKPTVHKNYKKT